MADLADLYLKTEFTNPESPAYLGDELLERIAIIAGWDLETPKNRALTYRLPEEQEQIEVEYKRFMVLILLSRSGPSEAAPPVAEDGLAPSDLVDRLWHAHMVLSRDYFEFTETAVGGYVHHEYEDPPRASTPRVTGDQMRRNLEAYFDNVDTRSIWAGAGFYRCWPEGR